MTKMTNIKVFGGAAITMTAASSSWVEQATAYGQLIGTFVAVAVGVATLIHTINLIRRDKRDKNNDKEVRNNRTPKN